MKRASKFFSDGEKQRIEQAIADAEAKTSAEIVPALATASGRYDRAEDIAGLWFGLIAMTIAWFALRAQSAEAAHWGSTWSRFELPILIGLVIFGFLLGAIAAAYIPWLRSIFTPRKQMGEEVAAAAARVFFDSRVHHTEGATGLLIYLSLFERTATILADATVLQNLGQATLDDLCNNLIEGIRAGDAATALCETIADAGERLHAVLPRQDGDRDELSNTLITID